MAEDGKDEVITTEKLPADVPVTTMIGYTIKQITKVTDEGDIEELLFCSTEPAHVWRMYHCQDCCEHVRLADIVGDLDDLIGSPIVEAEEINNKQIDTNYGSQTWTFYRFSTAKGTVTLRWLGESNGYYSEEVDFTYQGIE